MGLRTAFLAISLIVFICISEEIIARDIANLIIRFSISRNRFSDQPLGSDVAEQIWIRCRKELKEKYKENDEDCREEADAYLRSYVLAKHNIYEISNLRQDIGSYRIWLGNWFGFLSDSSIYTRRKLISKTNQFRAYAPNLAPGPALGPGLGPGLAPGPGFESGPAQAPAPGPYYDQAPASSPYQPPSYPPAEPPIKPTPKKKPIPTRSVPAPPPPPRPLAKKNDIMREIIVACVSTAVITFILVALLFFCCFRRKRYIAGPRNGPRDEGPLLHLTDLSPRSSENSPIVATINRRQFASTSKKRSFLSRMSLKRNGNEFSSSNVTSAGLPPLKLPPGRSTSQDQPPPPPPPPPPPVAPPPPPPPKPQPPPPPKIVRPPPAPPTKGVAPKHQGNSSSGDTSEVDSETGAPKTKLKPFFWDKMANPDQKMVWHEISAGSFQFNEEMMESLFGYNDANKNNQKRESGRESPAQYIQIIDRRKAQNLSILLRALNVTTEEVVEAIKEGNELPIELLQTLLKMAPTSDEELKLRLYSGDLQLLGPAERFLKILVDIPFAFKRIESLVFMISLQEEVSGLKESLATLEVACKKLKNSRLFLKLLEAVLKTGNRMNVGTFRGDAQAFKLDTLLKLSDVKGADGKTTLLNFVVLEIIRSEGVRALRLKRSNRSFSSVKTDDSVADSSPESIERYRSTGLQVISGLSAELEDVKRAAIIDADGLAATLSNLGGSLTNAREFLNSIDEESDFQRALSGFIERADSDIKWLRKEEERIMAMVKSCADYFHGNAAKNEGLRLFAIVRDFLLMLEKVCKEVKEKDLLTKTISQSSKKETGMTSDSRNPSPDIRQRLFPAIAERKIYSSDESEDSDDSED